MTHQVYRAEDSTLKINIHQRPKLNIVKCFVPHANYSSMPLHAKILYGTVLAYFTAYCG